MAHEFCINIIGQFFSIEKWTWIFTKETISWIKKCFNMDNIYTEQIMAHYHNTAQAIYSLTQKD